MSLQTPIDLRRPGLFPFLYRETLLIVDAILGELAREGPRHLRREVTLSSLELVGKDP
jgi:hypothetical protein